MEDVEAWSDEDRLRAITGDDIAQASRTFKNGTSSTFDGLHPRQFSMLSPGGRQATAELLEFCEHTGEWPQGVDEVVISLIPKATGGTRPIGLFSGLYRLWTRVRRLEAADWEQKNSRDFFAARSCNGALDTVWQQAFRAERSVAGGGVSAAVLIDLKSFYDHFDFDRLQLRADSTGFPRKLTRLAVQGYTAGRRIVQAGLASDPIYANRGVVAGCGLATTWVKVYCMEALDAFQKRHPLVRLDTYIDDFTLAVDADTEEEAQVLLVRAALDLKRTVEEQLLCKLALDKSVVVGSTDRLAQKIADQLGSLGVVPRAATANLGVDFSAGKARKTQTSTMSKRAGRFKNGKARKSRVKKLKRAIGSKQAAVVAANGLVAATEYGASINGVDDAELLDLRKIAASGMSPGAGGRSLTALLLLKGDPTWRAATAPILQWVKVAWQSKHASVRLKAISFDDLRNGWTATEADRARLWDSDGKRKWKECRGPIDAMALSLDRIGWTTHDGITFSDDQGVVRKLLDHAPGQW